MIGILHPTDKCNLNCAYCNSRKGEAVMDAATLNNAVDFMSKIFRSSSSNRHQMEWHAAEPMTLPVEWYEEAEEVLKEKRFKWAKVMCSNFTMFDQEWAYFMLRYGYRASLSIDGDRFIHDRNRGEGTFDKVIQAIILLKQNKIRYGGICVLSEYACDHWDELYPFFRVSQIPIKINPEIPNNFNEKAAEAMIGLYDQWYADHGVVNIDPFAEMTRWILGVSKQRKCYIPCGEHIFSVDTTGDVYACSAFVQDVETDDYVWGNVNDDTWKEIWFGERRKRFLRYKNTRTEECLKCPYNAYCGGGCTKDSVMIGNTKTRLGSTCGIFRPLMDHINEKVGWMNRARQNTCVRTPGGMTNGSDQ